MPISGSVHSTLPALTSTPTFIADEVNRINYRNDKRTLETELIVMLPFLAKQSNNYPREALKDLIIALMPEDARRGYRSLEIQNLAPVVKSLCLMSIVETAEGENDAVLQEILKKHPDLGAIVEVLKVGLSDKGQAISLEDIQALENVVNGWRSSQDLSGDLLKGKKPYLAPIIELLPDCKNLDEEKILQKIDTLAPILEALGHIVKSSSLYDKKDLSIKEIIEWLEHKEMFTRENYSYLDAADRFFNSSAVRRISQWISGPSNLLQLRCLEATVSVINIGARELLKQLRELEEKQEPTLSLEGQKNIVKEFVKSMTGNWEPKEVGEAEKIINDKIFKQDETVPAALEDRVSLKLSPNLTDLDNDLYKIHPEQRPTEENRN